MAEFVPCVTKCNSCKASFATTEEVREHYRTDWHVMNSRRRGNGLAPVTYEEFKKVQKAQKPSKSSSSSASKGSRSASSSIPSDVKNILKTNIAAKSSPSSSSSSASSATARVSPAVASLLKPTTETVAAAGEVTTTATGTGTAVAAAPLTVVKEVEDVDEDQEEEEEEEVPPLPMGPLISIFGTQAFESIDECVEHMAQTYGFFIPDQEYLTDREGLLNYLSEKVKIGGMCLYCQKRLSPGWSCINHMTDKSHCKISYSNDDDFDELEDFYDFSSTFEDVSEGDEDEDEDEEGGISRTIKLNSIGELILLDGRLAGHRDLRRYYKQHFAPVDNRPSVLCVRRENLRKFAASSVDESKLALMTDNELMRLIEVQHKEVKKSRILAERAQTRVAFRDRRRVEYKSTVDKLRSSGTRHPLIRDYHNRLM